MLPKIDWSNENAIKEEIKQTKAKLSSLMHRNLQEVWDELTQATEEKIKIIHEKEKTGSAIPQVNIEDITHNRISDETIADIKTSGTVIIRGVIPESTITAWYEEFKEYLKENDYENQQVDPNLDTYFSNLKNQKPQIFNIFWSKCQVNIRQHANIALAKKFINSLWISARDNEKYFDYDKDCAYSDRIRIRQAGDTSLGLSPHIDGGSVERWLDEANQKIYRKIFEGDWQSYNPYDGIYRNEVENISSPAVCRAFRTYQGWVALTKQGPNDGTLRLIPMLKEETAYVLLRPFLEDVPLDELCGAVPKKAQAINEKWHQLLLQGLVSIPEVSPGDTVWWHADLIHAVEDEHKGSNESSVTYVGSSPLCPRNQKFLELQKTAFLSGKSSPDFAAENREEDYKNRATLETLTDLGKKQMGFLEY